MRATIKSVEVERVEQSLWGAFAEVQRSTCSSTPMSKYEKYAGSYDTWNWPQAVVLVRIMNDEGQSGIGWSEDGVEAASSIITRHFTRLLLGAEAAQIELLWDQMFRASIPYGRKGAAIEAISAVDLALWDLKGKALGQPVYSLLGGPVVANPMAYASHLQPVPMDLFVREAVDYVKQGYKAMKMRMPGNPTHGARGISANIERVAAVRDAVGDEIDLMVDAYMGWDLAFALRMAAALEPFHIRWIEEPLLPDEVGAFTELRRKSPIAIATGEHEFTHYGFKQLIDSGAADILQPDVHRVGGITAARRVCAMASAAGLEVVPHVFSGPTAHLVCSHTVCPLIEHLTIPVWAKNTEGFKPFILGEPTVVKGRAILSNQPGFGIKINSERLPHLAHWNA